MEVSEYTGKFSSSQFELTEPHEIGSEVVFQGKGSVVKEEYFDKQDGTMKRKAVFKINNIVVRNVEA